MTDDEREFYRLLAEHPRRTIHALAELFAEDVERLSDLTDDDEEFDASVVAWALASIAAHGKVAGKVVVRLDRASTSERLASADPEVRRILERIRRSNDRNRHVIRRRGWGGTL